MGDNRQQPDMAVGSLTMLLGTEERDRKRCQSHELFKVDILEISTYRLERVRILVDLLWCLLAHDR